MIFLVTVYLGPAVKRVEFVSDKMADVKPTDRRRGIIARNFSDPTKETPIRAESLHVLVVELRCTISRMFSCSSMFCLRARSHET